MGRKPEVEQGTVSVLPRGFKYWTFSVVALLVVALFVVLGSMLRGAMATPGATSLPTSDAVPTIYVTKRPSSPSVSPADLPPLEPAPKSTQIPAGAVAPKPEPVFGTRALDLLAQLPIRPAAAIDGYARSNFGPAWLDVAGQGCDARNSILRRDLKTVSVAPGGCVVQSGEFLDPYLGTQMVFDRSTPAMVQVDQVVSLADAWQSGAQNLSEAQRISFANDPLNLLAVDAMASLQKRNANAASWLPSNDAFRCSYVARQISVKATYGLSVTQSEHDALAAVLETCPQTLVPTDQVAPVELAAPPAKSNSTPSTRPTPSDSTTRSSSNPSNSATQRPVPLAPIPQLPLPKPPSIPFTPPLLPPERNSAPDSNPDISWRPGSSSIPDPISGMPMPAGPPERGIWEEDPADDGQDPGRLVGSTADGASATFPVVVPKLSSAETPEAASNSPTLADPKLPPASQQTGPTMPPPVTTQ